MMLASTSVQRPSFSANVRSKAATRVQARSPMVVRAASIAAEVRIRMHTAVCDGAFVEIYVKIRDEGFHEF